MLIFQEPDGLNSHVLSGLKRLLRTMLVGGRTTERQYTPRKLVLLGDLRYESAAASDSKRKFRLKRLAFHGTENGAPKSTFDSDSNC